MNFRWAICGLALGGFAFNACGSDSDKATAGAGGDSGLAGATDGGDAGTATSGGSAGSAGASNGTEAGAGGRADAGQSGGGAGAGATEPTVGGAGGAGGADVGQGGAGGAQTCDLGEVTSAGTQQNLDLFGEIVYFADGASLPAGRYRATYVDGCMKYSSNQDWTIHAYVGAEPFGWWFVGETAANKIVPPPGTVGYSATDGAYGSFDDCVAANQALPPLEFDFAGGKIGVWLQDSPYTDNLAGQDGRNPKWQLTLLGECQ